MQKILFTLTLFFISSTGFCCGMQNLDTVKQQLIRYHDSGQYEKNQASLIEQAKKYLKTRLSHKKPTDKFAMVLDIDETSLSNYKDMLVMNFGGTYEDIEKAEGNGKDPVIKPTLELYQYAKANNVAVFFITGRKELYRAATIRNLEKAGYTNWDGLIFRANDNDNAAVYFKTAARKNITQQGYDIVLNIGDQKSDLAGGYAEKTFQLPNPYYLIS